jgi:hypothetical protein
VFLIDSLLLTTSTNVNIYWNPKEKFSQQQQHFDELWKLNFLLLCLGLHEK